MKKIALAAASFFLLTPFAFANFGDNGDMCASGFGDTSYNGTYTFVDNHNFTNGTRYETFGRNNPLGWINRYIMDSVAYNADSTTVVYWKSSNISDNSSFGGGNFSVVNAGVAPAGIVMDGACPPPPPAPPAPPAPALIGWSGLFAGGNQAGSSTELLAGVIGSVGKTGTGMYPLIALAGVPIAFFIAYELVFFIRNTAGEKKYYRGKKGGGMELEEDQELGRAKYEIQETGTTRF